MVSTYDFTVTGDPGAAHGVVLAALAADSHQAAPLADGMFAISRGSGATTFLLGAMAGKRFHAKFSLQFFDDEVGSKAA